MIAPRQLHMNQSQMFFVKYRGQFNPTSGQLWVKFSDQKNQKSRANQLSARVTRLPYDRNHPDASYKKFLQNSSRVHRSHKVVKFGENCHREHFKNQPPEKYKDAFQEAPRYFRTKNIHSITTNCSIRRKHKQVSTQHPLVS